MPLAFVIYKGRQSAPEAMRRLQGNLQIIIAQALNVPENKQATLTKNDVELVFLKGGNLSQFNEELQISKEHSINKDIMILVLANDFPERKANIQERTQLISASVKMLLNSPPIKNGENATGFTYVRLAPAGFAEF